MIVDKINAFLSDNGATLNEALLDDVGRLARKAFERQFGIREDKATLRLSSIGRCLRQQAYKALGFVENGKQIDSRAKMVFFMGDLCELAVVSLARAAGCPVSAVGDAQEQVDINGIKGHPDGLLEVSGAKWLVEVKSMSSFSFKDFERGVLDDSYRYQCNAYMKALGLEQCVIVALNKDAGVLAELTITRDPLIVTDIVSRIETLKQATKDNLPAPAYVPNEKTGFLPWNCLYCGFWKTCKPTAEKVLVSGKYKLKQPQENTNATTATQ